MTSSSPDHLSLVASCALPTRYGTFHMHGFLDASTGQEHVALTMGNVADGAPVLARLHSECLTGDALFSLRCDCGAQLDAALQKIAAEGRGVLLYLRQEGRGIGLLNKIRAYALQDDGADTVSANEQLGFQADLREYTMCQPMLRHLAIDSVTLMTNNPRKLAALQSAGVTVAGRVELRPGRNRHNAFYLDTKVTKLGHIPPATQHSGVAQAELA